MAGATEPVPQAGPARRRRAIFIGCNALGDTLCTTPVLQAYRRRHPDAFVTYVVQNATYCRVLDGNPDVDLVLYNEHLWLHGRDAITPQWVQSLPLALEEPALLYHFDMNAVCASAENFQRHISQGFARLLGIETTAVRPVVRVSDEERRVARALVPGPCIVVSMHSNANPVQASGRRAKDWPQENWEALARHARTQLGCDVVAVGAERDQPPPVAGIRPLYGLPIKVVAALLQGASGVVTLENGIAHLAAAVDAATVELYAPIVPRDWALPAQSTRAHVIYEYPQRIPVAQVLAGLEEVRRPR